MTAADLLAPGERCLAGGKGLHAKPKPGVVEVVLGKRYMVLLDGETEAQPFSLKKVKRLGKPAKLKMGPVTGELPPESDTYLEGILNRGDAQRAARDQRPPTRLHIPDANVPMIPLEAVRHSGLSAAQFKERSEAFLLQPKPRKPSRSAAYLQHVRQHDCCNCGAPGPSDPDHVGSRGVGQKTSDYNCIPLCRACHRRRTDKNVLPEADKNFGGPVFDRTRSDTELIILRAQVQMLREWVEKIEKETP